MSLNKTLDRLFDEIRREAKRNADFADRLDAVLRLHESRRDVANEVVEDVANSSPASGMGGRGRSTGRRAQSPAASSTTVLNPVGVFKREGEDALTAALVALDAVALRALIIEHNLDPAGETQAMDEAELAAHIVAQAKRRAERDDKMFDY